MYQDVYLQMLETEDADLLDEDIEMQKAENRFVLIIHPPVLILGPNGVFLR